MEISKIPIIGPITSFLDGFGVEYGMAVFVIGLVVIFYVINAMGISQGRVVTFLFATAPLWLPYLAFHIFFEKWMEYVGKKNTIAMGRAVVEIKLPPEVFKSPEAMEFVMTQIHNTAGPDNLMQTYIDGKQPVPYTFELVSRGGDVHFYATLPPRFVRNLKDNLYAQYPGVEVVDLQLDYTAEVPRSLDGWGMMSFHLTKKAAAQIPIKTYIDFGLDKMPKEEEKIDPMTPMLEVMSSIGPGHHVWIQFICKAHRKKGFKLGQLKAGDEWDKQGRKMIDELMNRDPETKGAKPQALGEALARLTRGEQRMLEAMERNIGKYAYNTAIRWCYLCDENIASFDGGIISRVNRSFAATEERLQNGIGIRWRTDFDYKIFSDPFGKKVPALKKTELKEYKLRKLDEKGGSKIWAVFSVEELATVFHLPGTVARTPTLNRVTSTRGEAPPNLPVGR